MLDSITGERPDPRPRVLYIHPGNSPPLPEKERNAAYHLSKYMDGDLVTVSWDDEETYERNRDQYEASLGGFGYHPSFSANVQSGTRRGLVQTAHYLFRSLALARRRGPYDAIVVYGPYKTALAALLVKAFTGTPLVVQMITNPYKSLTAYSDTWVSRTKQRMMNYWLPILLRGTDHVHSVYPNILGPAHDLVPESVFPDFAAISSVEATGESDRYIYFLGHPWRLKGVDILIQAFNRVSPTFPDHRLVIVGHCPDRTPFEQLAEGNPKIEFHKAVSHPEAMKLMQRCTFFALASRTDAMPRVLFEAWAAGKAVVASAVDGIPSIVRDGETGLLFESEDVDQLAERLETLLADPDRTKAMGLRGREVVRASFLEDHYARNFANMISATVGRGA